MASKVTARYMDTIYFNQSIDGWGRILSRKKSTFSRWHREAKQRGVSSADFIRLMISRKGLINAGNYRRKKMSTLITFNHEGETRTLPLARACKLINMAESTFSSRWRDLKASGRSDQACFDNLKRYGRKLHKKRVGAPRSLSTEAATLRRQDKCYSDNKGIIDGFLLGAA